MNTFGKYKINIVKFALISTFIINFFNAYLYGALGKKFGFIGNSGLLLMVLFALLYSVRSGKIYCINNFYILLLFVYVSGLVIFFFTKPVPFVYELHKIMIFVYFVVIFAVINKKYFLYFDYFLINFLWVALLVNLFIIFLQYTVDPYIITYFGMPERLIESSMRAGRWAGFFENPNNLADTALLTTILSLFYNHKKSRLLLLFSIVTVLISTSKHAIGILVLLLLIRYFKNILRLNIKTITASIIVFIFLFFIYDYNENAIKSKSNQIAYFVSNFDKFEYLSDSRFIDGRSQNIASGLYIVKNMFPNGTGLGTWGDASSKYNDGNLSFGTKQVSMSDSSFIHLLVEQGVWIVLYFIIIIFPFFIILKRDRIKFTMLIIFYFATVLVTMGLSSGVWPYLFSYLYARIFYSREINKTIGLT